jgi:peroxiredoxin
MLSPSRKAPNFQLARLDGGTESLADLKAKPAVLAFYKVSCPVCQMTLPFLERIAQSGALQLRAISQDNAEASRRFNTEYGITFPTLLDSAEADYPASNAYQIAFVPSVFLVEPDGSIGWTMEGFSKAQFDELARRAGVAVFSADDHVPEWKAG